MKIKCIDKGIFSYLTIGKTYEVTRKDENLYWIINDKDAEDWYFKNWFISLSEYRNDKINKLLER